MTLSLSCLASFVLFLPNIVPFQSMAPTFHARGEEHMLYPAEYGRYQFFKNQRDFINKLTDISEEMRFVSKHVLASSCFCCFIMYASSWLFDLSSFLTCSWNVPLEPKLSKKDLFMSKYQRQLICLCWNPLSPGAKFWASSLRKQGLFLPRLVVHALSFLK